MDSGFDNYDWLNMKQDIQIRKNIDQGEFIILSSPIFKFNDYKKRQERGIMITNIALFNLKKNTIKRKISLTKIKAITISTISPEFVLHVPDEYDYRYASFERIQGIELLRRNKIISTLLKHICNQPNKDKMPIFFKEEMSLINYATTKNDKKKRISRIPTDQPQFMDDFIFKQITDENNDGEKLQKNYISIFPNDKEKIVEYEEFQMLRVIGVGMQGRILLTEKRDSGEWFAMKTIRKVDIVDYSEGVLKTISNHVNHIFILIIQEGGNLGVHLKISKQFEERRAKFYVACIVISLGYLHTNNFIYKNLRLEKLLMDEHGYVFLQDYNHCRWELANEAIIHSVSQDYMAPEVLDGGTFTKATDWWSMGIITYQMLTGRLPDQKQEFGQDISKDAAQFVQSLLKQTPNQRLGTQNDFAEVMLHPWLRDIQWDTLLKRQLQPPMKPRITGEQWAEYFT